MLIPLLALLPASAVSPPAAAANPLYALPRHMVVDAVGVQGLLARLATSRACIP